MRNGVVDDWRGDNDLGGLELFVDNGFQEAPQARSEEARESGAYSETTTRNDLEIAEIL